MTLPIAAAGLVAASTAGTMVANAADAAMSSLYNAVKNGTRISSLADLSRPFRVEPLTMVDRTLINQPYMEDVMKMSLTQFTVYYMQAFSALMNVGRIETLRVFDSLNPSRSLGFDPTSLLSGTVMGKEDYSNGFPSLEAYSQRVEPRLIASFEAAPQKTQKDETSTKGTSGTAKVEKLYEIENLQVGKLVNVELTNNGETAKIPVLLRLLPVAVKPEVLTHIFTMGGRDSWGERFELARAGLIRPVRDLIFGIDILDAHRRTLMNDDSGVYKAITDRRRNNVAKAAATGVMSAADASNIAIISSDTARMMAKKLYGKLDSVTVREKIFDNSYLLLLIVVDENREFISVYHRGLDIVTEVTFKEIKRNEKGRGQDMGELFAAMMTAMGGNNI